MLTRLPLTRAQWVKERDLQWSRLGPALRATIRGGAVPDFEAHPTWLRDHYESWCRACNSIGPLGSKDQQRQNLYAKRKRIRQQLPLRLQQSTPAEIVAAGHPVLGEALLDIDWKFSLLRTWAPDTKEDWRTCIDLRKLRRYLKSAKLKLQAAGGEYADNADRAAIDEIFWISERIKRLQLDEYELDMRVWRGTASEQELARPRPQAPRTYAERQARRGNARGRKLGSTGYTASTRPRMPRWLKQQTDADARAEREQRRSTMRTKPLPPDKHEVYLERKAALVERNARIKYAHADDRINAQCLALLEYAHGEGRVHGLGLEVPCSDGVWLWYPARDIPYSTQRAAALQRCAVSVDDGWCFPPMGQSAEP